MVSRFWRTFSFPPIFTSPHARLFKLSSPSLAYLSKLSERGLVDLSEGYTTSNTGCSCVKERMVTSTVHELKYVEVVGEGIEQYYKCSLCYRSYSPNFLLKEVKTHLVQAHYDAIGVVFANEGDDEGGGGAYSRINLDTCSNRQWEGPWVSDSEDLQEGKEEMEGEGDRSGFGNGGTDTAASFPTAMSWPKIKKEDADRAVARWFYANFIPFNAISNPYFKEMMEAVSNAGRSFVPPSPRSLEKAVIDIRKKAINKKQKRRRRRMW